MGAAVKPAPEMQLPEYSRPPRRVRARKLFEPELVRQALKQSVVMLRPDIQWSNPVMFVVEIGAVLTLLFIIQALVSISSSQVPITYFIALDFWLFLTVLFANFATALAEARGKAQADSLRKTRSETPAYRLRGTNTIEEVLSTDLRPGDRVIVTAGQMIPSDGEVIEGIASVNESAITGESAPVIREAGGDRSGVTGGTTVISDRIVVKITALPGRPFSIA
jgi:K+-transporting ATPase ATPase B chain